MNVKGSRLFLLILLFLIGCSHSYNPISGDVGASNAPAATQSPACVTSEASNRVLWGFWTVRILPNQATIEAIPDRSSAMHFNVVRLLEVSPCSSCLRIENIRWLAGTIVQADLRLQHPFPGLIKFTGFDVRGIFISKADYLFPETDRRFAHGMNVPRLLNPDGYTSLFNPTEFPEGSAPFPMLAYITGKYSTGGDLSSTLNPYVAYGVDNPRRIFYAGTAEAQTVQVYYPDLPFEFGYAVDASWFPAENVVDPVTDFPPEANCMEAYKIAVHGDDVIQLSSGGSTEVTIEIYDHQGFETISSVTVESPEIFDGTVEFEYTEQNGPDSWLYSGMLGDICGLSERDYPLIVRVEDTVEDPNLGRVDAWDILTVRVVGRYHGGWARNWGTYNSIDCMSANAVAVDSSDKLYVVGAFCNTVDFNPCGGDPHTAPHDGYLTKFDSSGRFAWARTWGSGHDCPGLGVAVDDSDNIYVAGRFNEAADFNPDGGDPHTSNGHRDCFLSKFNSSGDFQWARTWGGTGDEEGLAVAADNNGDIYVTGFFEEAVEFDPDGGVLRYSNGKSDIFLSMFDSDGSFRGAVTLGGPGDDSGNSVAVDRSGYVYITGDFHYTVDFNPGGGDPHSSNGGRDAFLCKFDSFGNLEWARTWGGSMAGSYDKGLGVAADDSTSVYVVGSFRRTTDLHPNGGDPHDSAGFTDAFFSKFDSLGNFEWGHTWGGSHDDEGIAASIGGSGMVHVAGYFTGTVDFDPDENDIDERNGISGGDIFLSKFDSSGDYQWVRTWGAGFEHNEPENGLGIAVDSFDDIYVAGYFWGDVDFAPSGPPCNAYPDIHSSHGWRDPYVTKYLSDGCW